MENQTQTQVQTQNQVQNQPQVQTQPTVTTTTTFTQNPPFDSQPVVANNIAQVNGAAVANVGPNPAFSTVPENPWARVLNSFTMGEVPSNPMIFNTMDTTIRHLDEVLLTSTINNNGKILVEDTKNIIIQAKQIIAEKNGNEDFQKFFMHSKMFGNQAKIGAQQVGNNNREALQGVKTEATLIADDLKVIALYLLRSSEFRALLLQLVEIFQMVVSSAQGKLDTAARMESGMINNPPETFPMTTSITNLETKEITTSSNPLVVSTMSSSSKASANNYNASANTFKTVANQMKNDAKNGKLINENKRNELVDRLKLLVAQIGSNENYREAVTRIIKLLDYVQSKKNHITQSTSQVNEENFDRMWDEGKIILQQYVGYETPEQLSNYIKALWQQVSQDQMARDYFVRCRTYIYEILRNPSIINNQAVTQEGRLLIDQGRQIFKQDVYVQNIRGILDTSKFILIQIRNDPSNRRFADLVNKLAQDFALDEENKPDIMKMLQNMNQLKNILIPVLMKELNGLRLPTIATSDPKMDIVVDNLVLRPETILPEFIDIYSKNEWKMNTHKLNSTKSINRLTMKITNVHPIFNDVTFSYFYKPLKIRDEGICNVDISKGTGMKMKITWIIESIDDQPMQIRIDQVRCSMKSLKIKIIRANNHKLLDSMVTGLFSGSIKRSICKSIVKAIQTKSELLNGKLNEILRRRPLEQLAMKANNSVKSAYTLRKERRDQVTDLPEITPTQSMDNNTMIPTTAPVVLSSDNYTLPPKVPMGQPMVLPPTNAAQQGNSGLPVIVAS